MTIWTAAEIVAAVIVGILSAARLTRLLVDDSWPPSAWARDRWRVLVRDGKWSDLVDCAFCAAPYFTAGVLATALWSDLAQWWWIINGWLAASYIASMIVVRDTPE